ncbi:hypothetical protein HNQ64_004226 [Prosthecobacter dejongeii]|uniref:Uncharacterized protein n=1 Tax=Prosthecobacter dejongeii TaxID=48465 RepID=A0A7W8DRX3_9BACT|nr:hypothetical protein [Prosthecobacter dejongeii]
MTCRMTRLICILLTLPFSLGGPATKTMPGKNGTQLSRCSIVFAVGDFLGLFNR